jgi:2-methylisocitrate lyase-like PEP mutase family enzyme
LAFVEAGADATFVEAPKSIKELARIPAEVHVGQIANIVFGGKTPDPGREELGRMGYAIVLYANATLQAALKATYEVLRSLKHTGSLADTSDLLASFDERQRVIGKEAWDAFEEKYRGGGGSL